MRYDAVRGIEVAVSKVVPNSDHFAPGNLRLGGQQLLVERVGRLTDLDEADPNRVEDQAVGQLAPGQVAPDRSESGQYVVSRCLS